MSCQTTVRRSEGAPPCDIRSPPHLFMLLSSLGLAKLGAKSLARGPNYHSNRDKSLLPRHEPLSLEHVSRPLTTLVSPSICTNPTLPVTKHLREVTGSIKT